MPQVTYLDSELELMSLESARFSWAGGDYRARPLLEPELALQLLELETEHEAYGRTLYDAVFPQHTELREGLREAVLAAKREKSRLRFRLRLSPGLPDWVHGLYWELLSDPDRQLALARSPDTAFSRYLEARQAQGEPPRDRPRLLCVISAPSDIARYRMAEIQREEVLRHLKASFAALTDAVEVTFLEPPATLERLREALVETGGFQLLHFFGHGHSRRGSALVLEDAQGRAEFVEEDLLAELFLGVHELRLVTLIACHGGAPSSGDPFSGLAGRLVQRGLPMVIAMRRAVKVESAHLFTQRFYRQVALTGRADAAVNEARQQLYLAQPKEIDWSSPILYSRLADCRICPEKAAGPERGARLIRLSLRGLRKPLPWLPALLAVGLLLLGFWPAAEAEARLDLRVSRLSFRLAQSATVLEHLDLEELAVTRLADLRLPSNFPVAQAGEAGNGFLLATRGNSAHVTLHTPPLPVGTIVDLDHQGERSYRITLSGSEQALWVTFLGEVMLKPLTGLAVDLDQERTGSLVLTPQSGATEIDVTFSGFLPDSFARDIRIDRLGLLRVIDQQTTAGTALQKESTLLAGEVRMLVTGRLDRLVEGETLRCSTLAGSLTGLRVGPDGIHLRFQGRVADLERVPPGLPPVSLMPSVLDLWLSRPIRIAVQVAMGVLAVVTLFFCALDVRIRGRQVVPGPAHPECP